MKQLLIGKEAQQKCQEALSRISGAISTTLGPAGLPSILCKNSALGGTEIISTKDGVTVLNSLEFSSPTEDAVLGLARQSATAVVLNSGDGTSSVIVLADALCKAITSTQTSTPQMHARKIKKEIDKAVSLIMEESVKDEKAVYNVALTSANGDEEIANVVMEALNKTSSFGEILIEKQISTKLDGYVIEKTDGYTCGKGYSQYPVLGLACSDKPSENSPFVFDKNPYVVVWNGNIGNTDVLKPILECLFQQTNGKFQLVVFANDFYDNVVNDIVIANRNLKGANKNDKEDQSGIFLSKIKESAERQGQLQISQDICAVTGAKMLDGGNYQNLTIEDFGRCPKIQIEFLKTTLLGRSKKHTVPERVKHIQNAIKGAPSDYDADIISTRMAELTDGLNIIKIYGSAYASVSERVDRVDDALKAAKAAKRSGILPGGGVSYIRAGKLAGVSPEVGEALAIVHRTIMRNFGEEDRYDYDFQKGDSVKITDNGEVTRGNFLELKVCDSADTVKSVMLNAYQLALLCSTVGSTSLHGDLEKIRDAQMISQLVNR